MPYVGRVYVPDLYIHPHIHVTRIHEIVCYIWRRYIYISRHAYYSTFVVLIHRCWKAAALEAPILCPVQWAVEMCARYLFEPLGMGQSVGVPMDPQFMLIIGSETIHFVLIIDPYPSVVSQIAKTLKNTHKCILCPALWLMKNLMSSTHTQLFLSIRGQHCWPWQLSFPVDLASSTCAMLWWITTQQVFISPRPLLCWDQLLFPDVDSKLESFFWKPVLDFAARNYMLQPFFRKLNIWNQPTDVRSAEQLPQRMFCVESLAPQLNLWVENWVLYFFGGRRNY